MKLLIGILCLLPISAWADQRIEWHPRYMSPGTVEPAFAELRPTPEGPVLFVFSNRTYHTSDATFTLQLGDLIVDFVMDYEHGGTEAERITILPRGPYISIPPELVVNEDETGEALIYPALM